MELNYQYNNQIYKIISKRTEDGYTITFNDTTYTVSASETKPGCLKIKLDNKIIKAVISEGNESKFVFLDGNVFDIKRARPKLKRIEKKEELCSPISGTVVSVGVKEQDEVKKGDVIMVIEAMKMEYLIKSPYDGIIEKIYF